MRRRLFDLGTIVHRLPLVGPRRVRRTLAARYAARFGVAPRLDRPVTFNEHILHRMIFDRDPRLRIVCDKIAGKAFIAARGGSGLVVPTLRAWRRPEEIDWSLLPARFVLKPTHTSGPVAIVGGPAECDPAALVAAARQWLAADYFDHSLEWGYRGVPRRLIAEPLLLGPGGAPPVEALVFTFGGRARLIRLLRGRKGTAEERDAWYDATGRRLALPANLPEADIPLAPADRAALVTVAERLSEGFSSLRVDCYLTAAGLKVGELTPYSNAGLLMWGSPEIDTLLGGLWDPGFDLARLPGHAGTPTGGRALVAAGR
ncbi:ATP-grasp fold amidoligase family protein [Rhodoplanes sp. TEM]|uniref:ATP-grasp fold amidoligase family protein n=1 Tax=Rhodoplanes tepidamans TaxID=200616 RepID=A0ABT5JEI5_RHOTP|nr:MULTISPECIES: ATP-grasp fold amidoligase family protein [Rhodoplanes]MDC7788101.1 ATP-grasp fold amidoligase family protein [Rhodoplanes tepidamans]MDC7987554.1 ATP-grasp fold amidoligase family protein [Rhodoplanes sp. TEM]MDQ0355609.1 hypothetical protein [Rhodoplanes tepidamans]